MASVSVDSKVRESFVGTFCASVSIAAGAWLVFWCQLELGTGTVASERRVQAVTCSSGWQRWNGFPTSQVTRRE
jgi:hypothetical protein